MRIVAEVLFILEQPRTTSSIITYLTVFDLVMEGVSVWRWIPPVERRGGRQMKGEFRWNSPLSLFQFAFADSLWLGSALPTCPIMDAAHSSIEPCRCIAPGSF